VEAEALAQLLDPATGRRKFDVLRVTYTVADAARMQERLLSDRHVVNVPLDAAIVTKNNAPPPKAVLRLLDRPVAESAEGLKHEDVSRIIGELILHGKQTDRDAYLELLVLRDENFQKKLDIFRQVTGDDLGEGQDERAVSQISALQQTLATMCHLPSGVTAQQYKSLMEEEIRDIVMRRWANQPLSVLGDKSPTQASSDPNLKIPLLAAILGLQILGEHKGWDQVDFNQLRTQLGLPVAEPIDPESVDVERLPLARLNRLIVDKLSDDGLITVYNRSVVKRFKNVIRRFGMEMVRRESLDDRIDKAAVYGVMAQNATDQEQGLELVEKAKSTARAKGKSVAPYLLEELDLRLQQGNAREASRLINVIQTQFAKDRTTQGRLLRLLAGYGLVRPDGLPVSRGEPAEEVPVEAAVPEAAGASQGLWTPDSASSASPAREGESDKPNIWLPGMD
jgi:hypothetical protein